MAILKYIVTYIKIAKNNHIEYYLHGSERDGDVLHNREF